MRRLGACLWVLLQGALLFAEPAPSVGVCTEKGLRIRSQASLSGSVLGSLMKNEEVFVLGRTLTPETIDKLAAPWYRIVTISGTVGWVFGGYLDTSGLDEGAFFLKNTDVPKVTIRDESSDLPGGKLALVAIAHPPATTVWHDYLTTEVLFVRTPNGVPQIVFTEATGESFTNAQQIWTVHAIDCLGDSRKEINVIVNQTYENGHGSTLSIYGVLDQSERYTLLGSIFLRSDGDGPPPEYQDVNGPDAVTRDGKRVLELVRYIHKSVETWDEQGHVSGLREKVTVQRETYELEEGKLVLSNTEVLESPTSE